MDPHRRGDAAGRSPRRTLPTAFLGENKRGIPTFGVVSSTLLASVLTVVSYTQFDQVFTSIVLLSVFTAVIPYLFSSAAQIYWLLSNRRVFVPHLVRDLILSLLALLFSFWALQGSGQQAVFYGMFGLLIGVPVYVVVKVRRREYGEPGTAPVHTTTAGAIR